MRGHGLPVDDALVRLDLLTADAATAAALALLDLAEPPTALFTAQNLVTIGALRALRQRGAHRRTALVGFDDVPLADLVEPGVTVIAQQPDTLGRQAAELLFERIGGFTGPGRSVVVPTGLVERGSGELPPS
jgi:LacI family transcriptional regulator